MAQLFGGRVVAPRGAAMRSAAVVLALLLAFLVTALGPGTLPVLARTCGTLTIDNGTATPGSGTTATTFRFVVRIVNTTGAKPSSVRLRIAGDWLNLEANGSDFKSG